MTASHHTVSIASAMLIALAGPSQAGPIEHPWRHNLDAAEPTIHRIQADGGGDAERRARTEAANRQLRPLNTELQAFFANEVGRLPAAQQLARIDGYIARYRTLAPEVAGTPLAKPLADILKILLDTRAPLVAEGGRGASAASGAAEGPYTDYEWLGQRGIMAMTNPLQREDFRASLARGIDFNVGVSAIEPSPAGWLVQLSGRLGSPGKPGEGIFCRVDGADAASLTVLRGITPPYGIVHATAPRADEFVMESRPPVIRIVFAGCRITPPDNGPRRNSMAGATGGSAGSNAPVATEGATRAAPVAPSPAGLRCQSPPPRREHERVMAHRLRQAWAIPEALRDDPTLSLTFAVTLNFDAELTAPVELLRSTSQRATPAQLRVAVEAGRQAILASAPFPELGQFAGGTMQVDMTPCD